ncbi:mitochondrial import receptor subunit TOM22 homolog [Styela clava]
MATGDFGSIPKIREIDDEDDEDFEDESVLERLYGLTEMFPERLRNWTYSGYNTGKKCSKAVYKFSRSSLWIGATSFILLVVPVVFEQERFNLEQQQLVQQRQMLLGPNAAMSGSMGMQPSAPGAMAPPPTK